MKNSRLAFLAVAELDQDLLIVEALAERLRGDPGPACEQLRERLAARPLLPVHAAGVPWANYGQHGRAARRRDGLEVCRMFHPRISMTPEDAPFVVQFPSLVGGIMPAARLDAEALPDALEEVDTRWPLAAWWLSLDPDRDGANVPVPGKKADRAIR